MAVANRDVKPQLFLGFLVLCGSWHTSSNDQEVQDVARQTHWCDENIMASITSARRYICQMKKRIKSL